MARPEQTTTDAPEQDVRVDYRDGVLHFAGSLTARTVGSAERECSRLVRGSVEVVDGAGVQMIDLSGAIFIRRVAGDSGRLQGFHENARGLFDLLQTVRRGEAVPSVLAGRESVADLPGGRDLLAERPDITVVAEMFLSAVERLRDVAVLVVDVLYWSARGIFDRGQYRKGSFTEQAFLMGSSALPIIATIMFLIGAISVLQSASTLRSFGAAIFVVDMLALGLARELAPLMTAILISGRSGSAIAAEISTMKFTEELDAIRTIGLNPVRFVVVPKLWAMVVSLPLLSVLALAFGILGGFFVASTYMDISAGAFANRLLVSLRSWDIVTGLIKCVSFAVVITVVGTYRGMNFRGGADGVGKATTASVVSSIFGIIIVDAIWGIVFYF